MKRFYTQPGCFDLKNLLIIVFFFLPFVELAAQEDTVEDRTYSPRFYIPNSDTSIDALPLKLSSADVIIAGVIADVTIKQVYTNEGTRAIEAKYVFPASTRAAVYYLHMRIGNRLMIADVVERKQAQQIYDSALANGNTATLLEQMTANVFQMSVANILPGDTIEIEMRYTELLVPTESVYEFVYPTVVGPRYTGNGGSEWTEGPYQHENEDPLYDFHIQVKINAGMPVSEVTCISNPDIPIVFNSEEEVSVIPDDSTDIKGNKDFILEYSLSGNSIQTGLLAYKGEKENFFLAMMQPPQHPEASDIPPREYVFIMDVSGSMSGFPISISKRLMAEVLGSLKATDRFNILFFAGDNYLFSPVSVDATTANISAAIEAIENQSGSGGTELLPGLIRALSLEGTADFSRIFLIMTDGYVDVEREAFDLIRDNLSEANFFTFGIGSSVNRYIIEGMAHVGQGEPFIATTEAEAQEKADLFKTYIDAPVLININAAFENFEAYDVEPVNIPDIFAERPVILYGKYNGSLGGKINITGVSGSGNYLGSLELNNYKAKEENKALMYLWARKRIQLLDDYSNISYPVDSAIIEEITSLGIKYNLLTSYTSFIVVDSIVRCDTCSSETVNQPLPMPEGVTDNAMGYASAFSTLEYDKSGKDSKQKIIQVYPNPVVDLFAVSVYINNEESEQTKSIQVIDLNGRIVGEIDISNLTEGRHTLFLRVKNDFNLLNSGNYFVSLTINSERKQSVLITIQ